MANTPTTPSSVSSRLTDDEILRLTHVEERYLDHKTADVLRDYVRLRNENAKLKSRLEAVVKECERINDATFERSTNKVVAYKTKVDVASDAICHRILRAARGEGGAE